MVGTKRDLVSRLGPSKTLSEKLRQFCEELGVAAPVETSAKEDVAE